MIIWLLIWCASVSLRNKASRTVAADNGGGAMGDPRLGFVVAAPGGRQYPKHERARADAGTGPVAHVVAITRGQIRKMVLSQAAIIGLIGVTLGIVSGVTTAYVISLSMIQLLGYPVAFVLHPWLFVGCFLGTIVLVLLASVLPAERAARLDLLEAALQYE